MVGWKKTTLANICQIKPPKKEAKEKLSDQDMVSFVPMNNLGICFKNINLSEDKALKDVAGSYTYFANNDVLLAKITPCFENGKLGIATGLTNGVGFGSSEFIVFRSKGSVDPAFLFYFLSQDKLRASGAKVMTGAVGHKRVPKEFIENHPVLLPPLPEQKRIVAILDEAFAGIDAAVANTKKNLANGRELFASYLNGVFTRKGEGWVEKKLIEFCHKITVGHVGSMASEYKTTGIPFLRSQNILPFRISLRGVKFIDDDFNASLKKSELKPGDVAIVRTGYPGTAAVIPDTLPLSNCSDLVIAKTKSSLSPYFLALILNSEFGKRLVGANLVGAAQKHFNVTAAKNAVISVPPITVQEKLIAEVDAFTIEAQHLESIYQQKLTALAELKQSILQKAFAGELTTLPEKTLEEAVA